MLATPNSAGAHFMVRSSSFLWLPLLLFVGLLTPGSVHAETYQTCTGFITSLPVLISSQGKWCLKSDLATAITAGNAITVNTNNVIIDCNDFKIGDLAAGAGTVAIGVYSLSRANTTVRHCNIRGFYTGILLGGIGSGALVEDNRLDNNTYVGIEVDGDSSIIRGNRVFDTGGSTATPYAHGINAAYSVDVIDNVVDGVTATSGGGGSSYGIVTTVDSNGSVSGNRVRNLAKDGIGVVFGIFNASSGHLDLRDNFLVGDGSSGSIGLQCSNSNASARDNSIDGFETALQTCTDSGGNVAIP